MIKKLFIVSNHNSNCEWIKNYPYPYVIFDRSDTDNFIFDKENTIKVPNVGHNIYDYCMFFYNYYDRLPDFSCLLKGNMFLKQDNNWVAYKYITKEKFNNVINNNYYTMLNSWGWQDGVNCLLSKEGGYLERNQIISYLSFNPPLKYKHFINYNDFLKFIFKDPTIPEFLHFSPGACYIVEKESILKYPKIIWLNMTKFIEHDNNPFESHLVERMLHSLFTEKYELQDYMKEELKL